VSTLQTLKLCTGDTHSSSSVRRLLNPSMWSCTT